MKPDRKYDKDSVFTGIEKSKPCIYKLEKEFERILNDYSLDYAEKEKEIRRYTQIFMSK